MSATLTADADTTEANKTRLLVERSTLLQALIQTGPAAATRGMTLPILRAVHLQQDGPGRLRVTATDLDITVSCTVPADIDPKFDVCVNAALLQKIVRQAAGPLTFTAGDGDVTVTWARTVAILNTFPVDEFPKPPPVTGPTFTLSTADIDTIRRISAFSSTDDARPILTGLRFSRAYPAGIAATDSYRLGVAELDADLPEEPFLLPSRVARFLPRLIETEEATVTVGDKDVQIDVAEISIRSTLIAGEFPPLERLIPKKTTPVTCKVTFNRADLHQAARTAGIMAIDATPVRLEFDGNTARVVCLQRDVGQLSSTVDIKKLKGDPPGQTCAFNVRYLQDLLSVPDSDDVTLEINDHLKPVILRDGRWTLLLMPVRVS